MSLDLSSASAALVSFGHAAFLGIGAYAVGILSSHGVDDALVQLPVALAASALFALVTGAISLRTKGVYFIMITLAFGQMLFFLATSLAAYGGDDGMTLPTRTPPPRLPRPRATMSRLLLRRPRLPRRRLRPLPRRSSPRASGACCAARRRTRSRMQAIGFDPFRFQLTAYVISGTIAGLAGFLLANQAEFVSPAYMTWQRSGELIFMVVLGGLGSSTARSSGPPPSCFSRSSCSDLTEHWKMIFGPMLVLVVLFARGGIVGLLRRGRDG